MKKAKTRFVCGECGAESPKWLGRCPHCGAWGAMKEETALPPDTAADGSVLRPGSPVLLRDVEQVWTERFETGSAEFDRVLGGGVIPGSLFLVGGDPGIGKSTLLLQTAHRVAAAGRPVLYVTGEESPEQVRLRGERLGTFADGLYVLAETDFDRISQHVRTIRPEFVILDSIQTLYRPELPSAPGSPQQVRECALQALRLAKSERVAICVVGHVTKDGTLAGPRLMEHMVDAVLYFEGDRHHRFRVLRSVKNRFGSTNEIGVFDMQSAGLVDVLSPSEFFLAERSADAAGSAVVAVMEGTRPVLAEIQALIAPTSFGNPRRMASGLDSNRLTLLMAVLERRVGLYLQGSDAYVNVAGGMKIDEPGADLAIAVSVASSLRDRPVAQGTVLIGEVGLTGEVRAVTRLEQRVQEAKKLGFQRIVAPRGNVERSADAGFFGIEVIGIEVIGVATVHEAIRVALGET